MLCRKTLFVSPPACEKIHLQHPSPLRLTDCIRPPLPQAGGEVWVGKSPLIAPPIKSAFSALSSNLSLKPKLCGRDLKRIRFHGAKSTVEEKLKNYVPPLFKAFFFEKPHTVVKTVLKIFQKFLRLGLISIFLILAEEVLIERCKPFDYPFSMPFPIAQELKILF